MNTGPVKPEPEVSAARLGAFRVALLREAAAAQRMQRSLESDIDSIGAARRDSATDDEHDPEGATLAFERSQAQSLQSDSVRRLAEINAALARLTAGSYGRCTACHGAIGVGRLEARPWSARCIRCAADGENRRPRL